jgi:hypothetical protein
LISARASCSIGAGDFRKVAAQVIPARNIALVVRVMACLTVLGAGPLAAQTVGQGPRPEEPRLRVLPQPSLNFYGLPGLIDMPSAETLPDGTFALTLSHFGGQSRYTLTFQALPWLGASFRYNGIQNLNLGGFSTYYDRGFDVRLRLLKERRRWPEITLGLQDFVGTGIYAGEYIVATKRFDAPGTLPGRLKLTAGLGWGRLGSNGSIGSPFGANRPTFDVNSTGGQVAYEQWFRGPAAPFGGIEWQVNDRFGLKVEYSSDAYVLEERQGVLTRRSSVNVGAEWQLSPRTRLGAYYLYGQEYGLSAQIQLNPNVPVTPLTIPAPRTLLRRPDIARAPEAYQTDWAASDSAALTLRDRVAPLLKAEGVGLESIEVSASRVELRFRNERYSSTVAAIGRAARVLANTMPPSVETFRLVPVAGGMGLSATELRRSDLEALEFDGQATEGLRAVTGIGAASARPGPGAVYDADRYPAFNWSIGPYFRPSYFDPDLPFRLDVGAELAASWQPAPGWVVAGAIQHRLAGNVADGRGSNSVLPRVRTEQTAYAQEDTTLLNLFVSRQWKPGHDLYARVSVGYIDRFFGGVSGEVLWKPVDSPLALGVELNYVRQRDFDLRLGFQDYSVATGHASAYYEFGPGLVAQVDVGRYLAGDLGATFSLDRTFDNGWSVGGFFTLTDVPAAEFGEGSFDKGIRFSIPVNWFLGKPTQNAVGTAIRPIQRDGGQKLEIPGRLYPQIRGAHARALDAQWSRIWE